MANEHDAVTHAALERIECLMQRQYETSIETLEELKRMTQILGGPIYLSQQFSENLHGVSKYELIRSNLASCASDKAFSSALKDCADLQNSVGDGRASL